MLKSLKCLFFKHNYVLKERYGLTRYGFGTFKYYECINCFKEKGKEVLDFKKDYSIELDDGFISGVEDKTRGLYIIKEKI